MEPKNVSNEESSKRLSGRELMARAIELARRCKDEPGRISPKVGAVIARDGVVIGEAFRGECSPGEHAEYTLLEQKLSGETLAGSTLFVTLEPCTSRNEPKIPCAKRIVERRIKKVFIGMLDPNPDIRGLGQTALREGGVEIGVFESELMAEVEEMNRDFTRQHASGSRTTRSESTSSNERMKTLTGVRNHAKSLLAELDDKKRTMSPKVYERHLETVFVAAGNGLQRARSLGAFDDHVDLLNILDGVDKHEYRWQSGNLASDRFHGFWFWIKANDDRGFDERGDYQPYALRRFIEFIDAAIGDLAPKSAVHTKDSKIAQLIEMTLQQKQTKVKANSGADGITEYESSCDRFWEEMPKAFDKDSESLMHQKVRSMVERATTHGRKEGIGCVGVNYEACDHFLDALHSLT